MLFLSNAHVVSIENSLVVIQVVKRPPPPPPPKKEKTRKVKKTLTLKSVVQYFIVFEAARLHYEESNMS